MFKKLQVAVILLCMLSYATAGTVSIGTASARGDMRVDNYLVKGNATLFDGSVVETGQATANLRLNKGTEITMSTASRGTLHSDRLVLQQGESELAASSSFQLEANSLRVTPNEPNSRGVVSLKAGNTVEVASLNGSFGVTTDHGVLLANVRPGRVVSFAMQAGGNPATFSGVGLVSFENGTYYLTTAEDVKYVLTCKDFHKYVGDKVVVSGTLQGGTPGQVGGTGSMLCVKSIEINGESGMSKKDKWIIAGVIVGGGVGAGIALANRNHPSPAASR
ncbi:MAG TPA: hypothetical protein VGT08_09840 [Terracidiphilus sp.]|nr:hypothetical protein [Terracidiphilus sp.]